MKPGERVVVWSCGSILENTFDLGDGLVQICPEGDIVPRLKSVVHLTLHKKRIRFGGRYSQLGEADVDIPDPNRYSRPRRSIILDGKSELSGADKEPKPSATSRLSSDQRMPISGARTWLAHPNFADC